MKPYTIIGAFRESGMWPISCKAGLKKIRQYAKKKKTDQADDDEATLPPIAPNTYFECEGSIQEWIERGPPETFSSPSRERYTASLKATKAHLGKAHLISHDHRSIQARLYEEMKRKTTSRRSIHQGGEVKVSVAREKKRKRDVEEKERAIRKAEKRIKTAVNKAKKALTARGVAAWKEEKARKLAVQELEAKGEPVPDALRVPIRDPEKNPIAEEREALLPHPSLIQALGNLQPHQDIPIDPNLLEDDPEFILKPAQEIVEVPEDDEDSEGNINLEELVDLSDLESNISIDSIAQNADFIAFGY